MDYKKQISSISDSIFNFLENNDKLNKTLFKTETLRNLKVYRRNLFFNSYQRLKEDYKGTYTHLGNENFRFLVRKYLIENKITSPNINIFSQNFAVFLKTTFDFHQDKLLEPISSLDLLNKHEYSKFISVPKGTFEYWYHLISVKVVTKDTIDFNNTEIVSSEIDPSGRSLKTI